MAGNESQTGLRGIASNWLDHQASIGRLTSHFATSWLPDYLFAYHDGEEIGPSIPARIAKRTGLKPSDL